ncbi:MFS transporter [Desulfopila sp. IMCC35008]|uniref:MFS transporter n=1 Tax=Desulfopila sp. IMCC35008 TaxID=2653858 RepID=UPI0013D39DE3
MTSITKKPMYIYLLVLTICATGGLHLWRTLFDNFSVHILGLDGHHVGMIQSVREIPGFLSLLVVYVLLFIREHKLSALAVLILGLGVSLTGLLPSFGGILFTTLLMSFGFHYFETTNQSLTLQYFDKQQAPLVFGKLRSISSASNIIVSILIFALASFLDYRNLYLLFGIAIIGVCCWVMTTDPTEPDLVPQHKHMIFRKQYWLYYALTFLAGARRQIFIAFAVFLLVKKFDYSLHEIALLFLLNNLINFFLAPLIGRSINRFGERKVLSLEYGALIFVFVAYSVVDSKLTVAFLYIADHIFFNFAIGIRTFFQKIADPSDIAPSMAVGFTINHIAAVILPVVGGLLWLIDYRIPFIAGAILSGVSLILVQLIPGQIKLHG